MRLPFLEDPLDDERLSPLVGMMGGIVILLFAAVSLSGQGGPSLAAATQLGILQGVPPSISYAAPANVRPSRNDILSMQYPDLPSCWVNIGKYSFGIVGTPYAPLSIQSTWCLNVPDNAHTDYDYYENSDIKQWWGSTFYSAIFSANAADIPTVGKTVYIKSSFIPHKSNSLYLGPAGCTWSTDEQGNSNCSSYSGGDGGYTPGSCDAYKLPDGYESVRMGRESSGSDGADIGVCYAVHTTSNSLANQTLEAGTIPQVAPGGNITLEWSCMPERTEYWYARFWDSGLFGGGHYSDTSGTVYSISPLSTETQGAGQGFSTGGALTDKKTIKAPDTKGTYTYTLACNGTDSYTIQPVGLSGGATFGGWLIGGNQWDSPAAVNGKLPVLSVQVEVTDVRPPTASFGGDDTGVVGRPFHISATFATHNDNETIVSSAINGCGEPNKQGCNVSVGATGNPDSLDYTFTPAKAGIYTYYAALKTSLSSGWDNYAQKSVTITNPTECKGSFEHANICPGAEDKVQSTLVTSCDASVKCEWTCEFGYTKQGNACVVVECTGAHQVNPPECKCDTGYEFNDSHECVLEKPLLHIETVPSGRARAGSSLTVHWTATGVAADSETCSVTSQPGGRLSATLDSGDISDGVWDGSGSVDPFDSQMVFTLSCRATETGAPLGSVSATVGLIPISKEI